MTKISFKSINKRYLVLVRSVM